MHKIIMMLAAAAALLLGLASCNMDVTDNYTVTIGYEFTIEDETVRAELQEYLEDFADPSVRKAEFPKRTYSDAVSLGREFFTQALDQLDLQFIMDHIQAEDDVIHLGCVMSGNNLQELISTIYWNWDWKQEMLLY